MDKIAMTEEQTNALDRLLQLAMLRDTGQARRVADFLLAWWNAGECGKFDLTDVWGCDIQIAQDMVTIFGFVAQHKVYPDALGYHNQFAVVIASWRPELTGKDHVPAF